MEGSGAGTEKRKILRLAKSSRRLRSLMEDGAGDFRICCRPGFISIVEPDLPTRYKVGYSKPVDVSMVRNYTFLIHNTGPNPAAVQLEISPDGEVWGSYGAMPYIVEPGGKRVFVPEVFLRYARFKYRSWRQGHDTLISIWFQGQT